MADANGWEPPKIKIVQKVGTLILSNNSHTSKYKEQVLPSADIKRINSLTVVVEMPNGNKVTYSSNITLSDDSEYIDDDFINDLPKTTVVTPTTYIM